RQAVLLWRIPSGRPAAGPRRRHPRPDRRRRLRPGRGGPQRTGRAGRRACADRPAAGIPRAARPGLRPVPADAGRARGLGMDRPGATARQGPAHRHQLSVHPRRLAAGTADRRPGGGAVRLGRDRPAPGHGGADLRPGLQRCHPQGQPAQAGGNPARERGRAGRPGRRLRRRPRCAGADAAAAHGRRAAGTRTQAADVQRRPRCAAGAGAAAGRCRPAGAAAVCQWLAGPADHVRGCGELAAAGGAGTRRCAPADGPGRGEVAGMSAVQETSAQPAWNRLQWSALDEAARTRALTRPVQVVADATRQAVAAVLDAVRSRGDEALRELTARFDKVELERFEVSAGEFAAAEAAVSPELRRAMADAASRIEAFHRAGMGKGYSVETAPGVVCERIIRPVPRVGLYVPAGSAPLPSTALMLCVPAALAGCRQVVLCTPPRADGTADPAVLVAARLAGVDRVFKLGGAQAIAALAFGTASVPKVDKIFGPGNSYVDEAKRQVAQGGATAIDMPAGPSEVLVIADEGADPAYVASDLLSQAEHGPDSQVLLLSDSAALIDRVEAELASQLEALPRAEIARKALASSRLVLVDSLDEAFAISNTYAPEHLILAL